MTRKIAGNSWRHGVDDEQVLENAWIDIGGEG